MHQQLCMRCGLAIIRQQHENLLQIVIGKTDVLIADMLCLRVLLIAHITTATGNITRQHSIEEQKAVFTEIILRMNMHRIPKPLNMQSITAHSINATAIAPVVLQM